MHASQLAYGVISGSHAGRDCVRHIILDAELHTTCPGERVFSSHQVQCNILTSVFNFPVFTKKGNREKS